MSPNPFSISGPSLEATQFNPFEGYMGMRYEIGLEHFHKWFLSTNPTLGWNPTTIPVKKTIYNL